MSQYDVCIIGSGFGGSIPFFRLSYFLKRRSGSKPSVILLERGPDLRDFPKIQSWDPKHFLNYTQIIAGVGVAGIVANCVGGGSVLYGAASLRAPSFIFDRKDPQVKRLWPKEIYRQPKYAGDTQCLDYYYKIAESMLGVRLLRWDEVPKRGGIFAKACHMAGHTCNPIPVALAEDCTNCGWCYPRCIYDKKNSLTLNYIPAGLSYGGVVKPNCEALALGPRTNQKGYWVAYMDQEVGIQTLEAKVVILAGGAIGTPVLLHRSREFLPALSPALGRHFSTNGDKITMAVFPKEMGKTEMYKGKVISTTCFDFLNDKGFTLQEQFWPPVMLFPFHHGDTTPPTWWGWQKKHVTREWGDAMVMIAIMALETSDGTVLPHLPGPPPVMAGPFQVAPIVYQPSRETMRIHREAEQTVREIVENAGGTLLTVSMTKDQMSDHFLGGCRMGTDIQDSVVNHAGEVHSYPGLFVTDGSCIPSSLGVNPSLTIAAVAERASRLLIQNFDSYDRW